MSFDRAVFQRDVGIRMQLLRRARGLTQREVAALLGLSRATYASIERGRQGVGLDTAWKIAVILRASVGEFLPEPVWTQGTAANVPSISTAGLELPSASANK